MAAILDLARAAHAGPTIVVTAAAGLLAARFGGTAGAVLLVIAAVLTGQLSIGWSNDAIDAERDRRVGRDDKPMVTGALSRTTLVRAAAGALVATVALSAALGLRAGALQLLLVAMGWAYNLGLKSSVLSPMPYAVAFGVLPSVASLAVTEAVAPVWLGAAGGAIGVAAHIANVLPDLGDDEATGVRGLPHRLGPRGSRGVAAVVLAAAVAIVLIGSGLPLVIVVVVLVASALCVGLLLLGTPTAALPAIMVLTLVVIALAGGRLAG
ncbi:MAG: UbiA family prenyltransferase [Actinomycetia bacterium]|nr:UbiA family prenyltransferase [Actinomycetes bacterium]